MAKYEQTHALRKQGYLIKDIAHHLGIGKRTVYTYLAADTFPEYKSSARCRRSGLDLYTPYFLEQWNNRHHNAKQLFKAIQQQGYKGSYTTVTRYIHQFCESLPSPPKRDSLNDLSGLGPTPPTDLTVSNAAWLVMRKIERLTEEDEEMLEQLNQQSELSEAIGLAQSFLFIVRKRLPQHLDLWLKRAKNIALRSFKSFAKGLQDNYKAVKATLTLEMSNGQVEGQNNRLKMVKRQMYGRASLDLLNKHLVLTS